MSYATGPTHSADDDLIININSAPLSPASIVRTTTLVKLISVAQTNNNADGSENDDCEESARPDTPGTQDASFETSSYDDDDCNFIGNIEIVMPISPLLSTQQRNIRKNAYDLLKRLGEEESLFDMNSVEAKFEREDEEEGYTQQRQKQQQQQHVEVQEVVDGLKRQLEECTDMVVQLHDNLRSYSNDAANDDVISTDKKRDNGNWDDDVITAELHAEIATLTSQLQSAAMKNTQGAHYLQRALQESSHHYLDKIHEYEETIDSLNEAVVRSHLYNEEILMELLVLRKENDDLTTKLFDSDKKREEEKENHKSTYGGLLLS